MMNFRKFFFGLMCLLAIGGTLVSCSDDDDITPVPPVKSAPGDVFFLNEGNMGTVDATLCLFNSISNGVTESNLFQTQNGESLGDVGQDMILHNGYVYISVSNSKVIFKVDKQGRLKGMCRTADNVRGLAAKGNKLYASCYGGKVLCINTTSMKQEKELLVAENCNLEGMTIKGNTLYVANSYTQDGYNYTYHNTLKRIDLGSFTADGEVVVGANPNHLETVNGTVYGICWGNYTDQGYSLGRVIAGEGGEETWESIVTASRMCAAGNKIYYAYSETNWSDYTTSTTFGTYDITTGELKEESFLQPGDAADELASSSIYMLAVDPDNGDIYVGTSSYYTTATMYRFSSNGTFIGKFDTGGFNASHAVFLD